MKPKIIGLWAILIPYLSLCLSLSDSVSPIPSNSSSFSHSHSSFPSLFSLTPPSAPPLFLLMDYLFQIRMTLRVTLKNSIILGNLFCNLLSVTALLKLCAPFTHPHTHLFPISQQFYTNLEQVKENFFIFYIFFSLVPLLDLQNSILSSINCLPVWSTNVQMLSNLCSSF